MSYEQQRVHVEIGQVLNRYKKKPAYVLSGQRKVGSIYAGKRHE